MTDEGNAQRGSGPRILVVGNTGQLGRELERSFAGLGPLTGAGRRDFDLADAGQMRAFIQRIQPNVILNAAAYTAVDRAESEPELAQAINVDVPRVLAEAASERNALFVHYSTDYVFDGSKPEAWTEEDTPHPLNVYGATKLAGERAVASVGGKFLIFRTSWVYGPHGKNFLFNMLRLGRERERLSIVDDQVGAPTTSIEVADATRKIVEGALAGHFGGAEQWAGLYHMTCAGATSWYGFTQAIVARAACRLGAKAPELTPIASQDYPTRARRPLNSVLSNEKLAARFGLRLAAWEDALEQVIDAIAAANK